MAYPANIAFTFGAGTSGLTSQLDTNFTDLQLGLNSLGNGSGMLTSVAITTATIQNANVTTLLAANVVISAGIAVFATANVTTFSAANITLSGTALVGLTATVPTTTVLSSGSGTYTTPVGSKWLLIELVAA